MPRQQAHAQRCRCRRAAGEHALPTQVLDELDNQVGECTRTSAAHGCENRSRGPAALHVQGSRRSCRAAHSVCDLGAVNGSEVGHRQHCPERKCLTTLSDGLLFRRRRHQGGHRRCAERGGVYSLSVLVWLTRDSLSAHSEGVKMPRATNQEEKVPQRETAEARAFHAG